eukprot:13869175-Heterocapsa_arctica.AAC.1
MAATGADEQPVPQVVHLGSFEEAPPGPPGVEREYGGHRALDGHHRDQEPQGTLLQLHDQGDRQGQGADQGDAQRRNWRDEERRM